MNRSITLSLLAPLLMLCACETKTTNGTPENMEYATSVVPKEKPISEMTREEIEQTPRFKAKMRELAPTFAKYTVEFKTLCSEWERCSSNKEKREFIYENEDYVGEMFDVDISTIAKAENLFVSHPAEFMQAMELKFKAQAFKELAEESYQRAIELEYSE